MIFNLTYRIQRHIFLFIILLLNSSYILAQNKTEILWDRYDVPHIFAKNESKMYYAFGWAQMQNHANLLLKLYGQARGRAAEYWGTEFVDSDKKMLMFSLLDSAKVQYERMDKNSRFFLDSFVQGINDYAKAHPEDIDTTRLCVLPISPFDVLAHSKRIIWLEFLAGKDIRGAAEIFEAGSNAYAIGPSKSASGKAMLLTNPHLPWQDFYLFFEAHLSAPGFNAYGVSLIGQPTLNIAFNENLGWTHTVNTIEASDRYKLSLKDDGYLLDGVKRNFHIQRKPLKIRQPDGSLKMDTINLFFSLHGPVYKFENKSAVAVRIAGLENTDMIGQYHSMAKAKSWTQFEQAIKLLQNPMFNIIYADKAGNIMYFFNGNVPKRTEGDWSFWKGIVDGKFSKYIWQQYHTFEELPMVFNPESGFVQNANDAPWTCTYPQILNAEKFPSYMSPHEMQLRPQRAVNMIKDDSSITFEELVSYKHNTGMEAADRFLDELLNAVEVYGDSTARKAATVLKKWDRATNADSRGAVLFEEWYTYLVPSMIKEPWNKQYPVTTPKGLKDPKEAAKLLSNAAVAIEKKFGSTEISWGEVNRFKINNYNYPANGGPGNLGIFRTFHFNKKPDNLNYVYQGDTYVAITEFGPKVKAQVLLSYGNATQQEKKQKGEQLRMLSEKKLRGALFYKDDVLKNFEKREILKL